MMTIRGSRRRGLTLVELLVFSTVGLLVVASAWTFFTGTTRNTVRTGSRLDAIEAGLHLSLRLERDLDHLYEDQGRSFHFEDGPQQTTIRFHRFAEESPDTEWTSLPVVRVLYTLDKTTGVVTRQVDDQAPRRVQGCVASMKVQLVWGIEQGRGEESAEEDLLSAASSVLFTVLGATPESLDHATEAGRVPGANPNPAVQRVLLMGGKSRRRLASYLAYDFWNPVPYGDGT